MKKTISLGDLQVEILPPKVIMLLSKFSHRLRSQNGMVLKLSSKTILKELEQINKVLDDDILDGLYARIEAEMSEYLNVDLGLGKTSEITLDGNNDGSKPYRIVD